jgi:hypothetical protein
VQDVTDQLRPGLEQANRALREEIQALSPTSHPQAALMFAKHAAHQAHLLGQSTEVQSDFSYALNLKALATCLARHIDWRVSQSSEEPTIPDERVKALWGLQYMEELNRHQAACVLQGLRRIWFDAAADLGQIRLTKRRRVSALRLLDEVSQLKMLEGVTGGLLSESKITDDEVFFSFASSVEHLHYIQRADPDGWHNFSSAAGFTFDQLTMFSAFLVFLEFAASQVGHSLVYDSAKLVRLYEIFKLGYPAMTEPAETLLQLVKIFSLSPADSERYLLPVPFFELDGFYLRAKGFENILSPAMGLLTIAIRKNEDTWNRTLGSTLARAADVVTQSLPKYPNIYVATRRRFAPAGDIDLAIYDTNTRRMLLCEVKTVYDKHRTVIHMHRFEDAKVKLGFAVRQIRAGIEAVRSRPTDIRSIFGQALPPPQSVEGALLTWLDPIDLTVGTSDEDILCLNFATLAYLFGRSQGNLGVMIETVRQLRNVWCVAMLRPIDLQTNFPVTIETQIPTLNSVSDLAEANLSALTKELVAKLDHLPDDWRENPEFRDTVVSYLSDTLRTLGSPP